MGNSSDNINIKEHKRHCKQKRKINYKKIAVYGISIIIFIVLILISIKELRSNWEGIIENNNIWIYISEMYLGIAVLTFIPILLTMFDDVELVSLDNNMIENSLFSESNRKRLIQCNKSIIGTLKFWKKQAKLNKQIHYYSAIWSTLISVVLPILIQSIDVGGKGLLTLISTHSAVLIAFHKGFKIENKYRLYRSTESNFYDIYRDVLNYKGGNRSEDSIVDDYIMKVKNIRDAGRKIEIDNIPNINYAKKDKDNNDEG